MAKTFTYTEWNTDAGIADVLCSIRTDIESGALPHAARRVASFADLHDHCDANMYLPFDLENEEDEPAHFEKSLALANAVIEGVSALLAKGVLREEWDTFCGQCGVGPLHEDMGCPHPQCDFYYDIDGKGTDGRGRGEVR